jgi:hypothetical protein
MADLTFTEKRVIEQCFGMSSGYVLDFSDRTFNEFIQDAVARNIDNGSYSSRGTSKANRLRAFFQVEQSHVVGILLSSLIEHARSVANPPADAMLASCERIAERLKQGAPVLGDVTLDTSEATFNALAKSVRQAIDTNQPQTGLDRLHTYFVTYMRQLCENHGIDATRDEPAHSVLGKYLKYLKNNNHIETEMTERILKYALGTMDPFNHVRNNQSLAHPNAMLNYDEALLIFSHVIAVVHFVRAVEVRISKPSVPVRGARVDDDIPF